MKINTIKDWKAIQDGAQFTSPIVDSDAFKTVTRLIDGQEFGDFLPIESTCVTNFYIFKFHEDLVHVSCRYLKEHKNGHRSIGIVCPINNITLNGKGELIGVLGETL